MSARTRLALGLIGIAATSSVVRRDRVGPREVSVFRAVNGLPDRAYGPLWLGMQAGALGAVPVAAAGAELLGRRDVARRLAVDGLAAWLLAKVVKRAVQRPRPVVLLADTHCRGPEQAGMGYVSGHAAVVTALVTAAVPRVPRRLQPALAAFLPAVGVARMYVGAHLPLDVVGGAALGLAADAGVTAVAERRRLLRGTRRLGS